ncbi:hypothetical protein [Pseudoduganella chitinolytica]|uniref:Uncharacterized protein n=1 Tax=Pseudoduganella chitinolytica TaxID=34070 RepID=A0ABY8B8E7_9BURK|nr:hypothetical protein [Pseudoduganella chitinolytica]WEF30634.1 hypothetical protein PX653_14215 [Pseudoduganella chitinolytica]
MTPAFAEFTRQYHLTGREKADGYDWTAFAGLADDEKPVVFDMLEQELPWASDWFFALDPARALVVAQRIEPGLRGRSGAHWLQQQIVRYAGDLRYQRHMMEDYPNYTDRNRAQVIDSLAATPANRDTIAFFKQLVTTEVQHDAVFRAGWALLSVLGVPGSTEPERHVYHRILDGFRQPEAAARLAALAQLAPYEALWHKRQTLVGAVAAAIDNNPERQHYVADLADYAPAGRPGSIRYGPRSAGAASMDSSPRGRCQASRPHAGATARLHPPAQPGPVPRSVRSHFRGPDGVRRAQDARCVPDGAGAVPAAASAGRAVAVGLRHVAAATGCGLPGRCPAAAGGNVWSISMLSCPSSTVPRNC